MSILTSALHPVYHHCHALLHVIIPFRHFLCHLSTCSPRNYYYLFSQKTIIISCVIAPLVVSVLSAFIIDTALAPLIVNVVSPSPLIVTVYLSLLVATVPTAPLLAAATFIMGGSTKLVFLLASTTPHHLRPRRPLSGRFCSHHALDFLHLLSDPVTSAAPQLLKLLLSEPVCLLNPSSSTKFLKYIPSLTASTSTIYSASVVDKATKLCRFGLISS